MVSDHGLSDRKFVVFGIFCNWLNGLLALLERVYMVCGAGAAVLPAA